ncbi:LAMI_0A02938g1_1 [Lachancea mirantina]|uniref:Probable transporter MCH1 n=1 Tax=Lachancea mirantina TaxID=1230905 RepID=A0A1G4IMU1_9SACH|nr:LAMI_0A02938g1_1 [Lachancea mirantina]
MPSLSALEHSLTVQVRAILHKRYSLRTLRHLAFAIALVSCIAAGLITVISLFTRPWKTHMHYTALEINLLASAVNLGGYLTPPFLGVLSDSHGPVVLSWLAVIAFVPSYAYSAHTFQQGEGSFALSVVAFCAIGVATSALYFSALLTCAKLHPESKLLSISLPTTFYGLSSLVASAVLKHPWFWNGRKYLDLARVFKAFAWFYVVVGLATWVSTSIVAILKTTAEDEEHEPLIPGDDAADLASLELADLDYSKRFSAFARDPSAYLLLLITFLTIGSLEMFLANMGSVASLLYPGEKLIQAKVLSFYAFSSTSARILVGLASDLLHSGGISRIWVLYFMIVVGLCSQILPTIRSPPLTLIGILSGASYGGLFTAIPTMTLSIWGDRIFGTAYGCFMVAPALGSTLFGLYYAHVYDHNCDSNTAGSSCIAPAFSVTSFSFLAALVASICVSYTMKRHQIKMPTRGPE